MSDAQVQLGSSWRSHRPSDLPGAVGSAGSRGSRRGSVFGESVKLMETEKSPSTLSFNWKEENLLRKKLGFLESMKQQEASARLMEQRAFYKRCLSKLQRLELAHARLLGDRDLVHQLTCQNRLSYSASTLDESAAAVKAIVQGRRGRESGAAPRGGLDTGRCPLPRPGRPQGPEARAALTVKAACKEEATMTAVNMRSHSGWEGVPVLLLSLDSLGSPEPGAPQRLLPVACRPTAEAGGTPGGCSRGPSSATQSPLQVPPRGQFLQYIVLGDTGVEQPKKKRLRPRNSPGSRGCAKGPGAAKPGPCRPSAGAPRE